jgi:hypothetical protein
MRIGRVYLYSIISVVALVFLVYSLLNLESLKLSFFHPMVLVKAVICFIGLALTVREVRR